MKRSVLFCRSRWTTATAKAWLRRHGYKGLTVDAKSGFLRFRQVSPGKCTRGSFRTINFGTGTGIKATVCCPER